MRFALYGVLFFAGLLTSNFSYAENDPGASELSSEMDEGVILIPGSRSAGYGGDAQSMIFREANVLTGNCVGQVSNFTGHYGYSAIGNTENAGEASNCGVASNTTSRYLNIPAGSTISAAYLYWSGSTYYNNGIYVDQSVTLNGTTVNANKTWTETIVNGGQYQDYYGAYANVTNLVSGSGNYSVSSLYWYNQGMVCASYSAYGGWAMVVVYENGGEPERSITVYDTFNGVWGNGSNFDQYDDFCSPNIADCSENYELTAITWEGDNYKGEYTYINGTYMGDNRLAGYNSFDGTSNYNLDIDRYDLNGIISSSDNQFSYRVHSYQTGNAWEFHISNVFILQYDISSSIVVDAGSDVEICNQDEAVLTANVSGAETCAAPGESDCNHSLETYGGYVENPSDAAYCGSGAGAKLWTRSGQGTSFVTIDFEKEVAAGTEICVNMRLEHCSNTTSGSSSAKIQSASASGSFVNVASNVGFSSTSYSEYCYTLGSDTRYVRVIDNGQCAFRVDYVRFITQGATTNGVTYAWSGPGIVSGSNASSITVNQSGTYSVTATDCYGCQSTDQVQVTINAQPTLVCESYTKDYGWVIEDDCHVDICEGEYLKLSVNPNISNVVWSGPNGFSVIGNDALISGSITTAASGDYTATLTDGNGCTASTVISVNVEALPDVTVSTTDANCNDSFGSITFSFPDNPDRTKIEFSLDGGSTYPYNVSDIDGSFTVDNLTPGDYAVWTRWGNDECPLHLGTATIGSNLDGCEDFNNPIFNDCGSGKVIDVQAAGLINSTTNCVTINNTSGMLRVLAEVWIEESDCTSGYPTFITMTADGSDSKTVQGTNVNQVTGSSTMERIYRAEFSGTVSQICLDGLSGCAASSIALYIERVSDNGSSAFQPLNQELYRGSSADDCITEMLQIGGGDVARDIKVSVPIHEKDNSRTVSVSVKVKNNSNQVLASDSQVFSTANAGSEAALYEMTLANVPGTGTNVEVTVCSPYPGGDSFGVGAVVVSSNEGCVSCDLAASLSDLEVCEGDLVTLTPTVSGGTGALSYLWSTGATTPSIEITANADMDYSVTVTDNQNCKAIAQSHVEVRTGQILQLAIFDLDNGVVFEELIDGKVYTPSNLPTNFNIQAVVNGEVASVRFMLSGAATDTHIENADPYRYRGDNNALNLADGDYTIKAEIFSADNAGGISCDSRTVDFTIQNCDLIVDAGEDIEICNGDETVLIASTTGAETCNTSGESDCNHVLANYGGWVENPHDAAYCGSGYGAKLWTRSGEGTSYVTIDLGQTLSAGTQICVSMKLEHCSNTSSNYSNAKIQASTSSNTGFSNLTASETFSSTSYSEYCYTLSGNARYIRVIDNGNCAFRVDYVRYETVGSSDNTITYAWSGPGIVGPSDQMTITVNQSGIYTVTATDCSGCTSTDEVNVTINQGPDLVCESYTIETGWVVEEDCAVTVCEGQYLMLSVNPQVSSVVWSGPNGYSATGNDALISDNITPEFAGDYTATLTDENGCTGSTVITVIVNETPDVTVASTNPLCGLINGTITFTFANNPNYTDIQFSLDGGLTYPYTTTDILGIFTVSNLATGTYDLYARWGNEDCPVDLGTVELSNVDGPTLTAVATNVECFGEATGSIDLTVSNGTAPFDFAWSNGAVTEDLVNVPAGNYTVTVTDDNGCTATLNKTITQPDEIVIEFTTTQADCGLSNATATVEVNGGTPGYTYLWSNGETSDMLSGLAAGEYTVTVTDASGCTAENSVVVAEDNAIDVTAAASLLQICAGESTIISSSVIGGVGPYTYAWSTGQDTESFTDNPTVTTTYEVTITDQNGCFGIDQVTVTVTPLPETNAGPDAIICAGESILIGGNPVGPQNATYVWSNGQSGTIKLNGANLDFGQITVSPLEETTYSVTVTKDGCSNVDEVTISVDEVIADAGDDVEICASEEAVLTATGGATYLWSTGETTAEITVTPLATTTYFVTVTSGEGCEDVDEVVVTVLEPPVVVLDGGAPICSGQTTTLTPDVSGGTPFYTYEWSTGAVTSSIEVDPEVTTEYSVTVTDSKGCVATATATVTVDGNACASLGDFVWEDLDGDGVQDPGEPGVPGVTVNLKDENGNVIDNTTTAADGSYSFTELIPGTYSVQFTDLPAGFSFTDLNAGGDEALDSDADPAMNGMTETVTLESGDNYPDLDAGILQGASLGDFVWEDLDGDGVQDPGEPGVGGVTVNLKDENGNVIDNTTTAADGSYSFTNLEPGTYSVQFTDLPAGFSFTDLNVGGDEALDSDADPAMNGMTETVTLESGDNYTDLDAGILEGASLGDFVWEDLDGDGVQDPGEPGVAGVTVNLKDENGNVIDNTTTAADGSYSFTNLEPGTYSVQFTDLPAGFSFTDLNAGGDEALDSDADPAMNGMTETVTLESGDNYTDLDAGILEGASLGDFVWEDLDGDGVQDPGEPGVGGVTVNLKDENGNVIDNTTTAADGSYSFTNLEPGTYSVQFTDLPAGFSFTDLNAGGDEALDSDADPAMNGMTETVTLESGNNYTDLDAGILEGASLGDFVWEDLDGDGVQDPGEPGVAGVTVNLKDENGNVIDNTTTAADGSYSFTNLEPGTYSVQFTDLPAGFSFTDLNAGGDEALDSDADPAMNGMTETVTLESGDNYPDLDAGILQGASLGDFVWEDLDGDGVQDPGEPGVGGVTVNLKDENGNVIDNTTTAADGSYSFTNLEPGTYSVQFTDLPAGFSFTDLNAGGDEALDSDADPAMNGMTETVTLESGDNYTDLDAGILEGASLGDFVWEDLDGDGIQDPGEPGVAGVTVNLKDENGNVIDNTTTAADGSYSFTNLEPGTYSVQFTDLPAGFSFTDLNAGGDEALDSDADPAMNGMTETVTLESGDNYPDLDAGILQGASLGDFVWEDLDGDGVQDPGEPGVAGVIVNLKDENGNVIDNTTTAADGSYSFTNLEPGTYSVQFTDLPAGFSFTDLNAGGNEALDSDADPAMNGMTETVTLESGDNYPDLDAGILEGASLGDFVWEDLDGDGVQDPGEPGVGGVTVNLKDENGNVIDNTTTAADGSYSFTNLEPGTYSVQFTDLPAGFSFTDLNAGGDEALDSDADPAMNGMTETVTLESGDNYTDLDAGILEGASLGDFVWEDLNGDGVQDPGEPGVGGVTVNLKDENGNVIDNTTTAADGSYSFTNLEPGTYSVQFTDLPAGFSFTDLNAGGDEALDSDADPAMNGMTETVTLESGDNYTDLDAGILEGASLGDFVWEDLDGDGVQDPGEPGVGGVTVNLKDENGNVIDNTTTAADGSYSFTNLEPGTYSVQFTDLPAGFSFTDLNAGGDEALDSDADPAMNGMTETVTLESGDNYTDLDAGILEGASLGDFVWEDLDGDGVQDPGEPGVGGVTVNLKDENGNVIDNTTTAADGSYSFTNLEPGTYSVQFTDLPAGFSFTDLNAGGDEALDSDADPAMNGMTETVTLESGDNNTDLDAGILEGASLGDFVWEDLDGDGVQDPGEPGVVGVTVNLKDENGNVIDNTTTAADGSYSFTNLEPGTYSVQFTDLPAGFSFTDLNAGGDEALDSDADPAMNGMTETVTLESGDNYPDLDAGILQGASLGDFVWEDLDGDGVQDPGEPGVGGVTVNLKDENGNVIDNTTTAADGSYSFTNLEPGTYSVQFTDLPAGFSFTDLNAGGNEALDSDADPAMNGMTETVTLESGDNYPDLDAGILQGASLGDFVWEDLDGDGVQDPGEPGVAGVTVNLKDENGNVIDNTTTAADGSYS
ncbi:hypothetical protein CRP01_06335, partial [Flavilitoribacter nigricans DSM 23189 = NBRC 102662]